MNYRPSIKPECFFEITTEFEAALFFFSSHFAARPPSKGVPSAVPVSELSKKKLWVGGKNRGGRKVVGGEGAEQVV